MSFRKALASMAALALVSSAAVSVPAIAQDTHDNNRDTALWIVGGGLTVAAILAIIFATKGNGTQTQPISP